jgi:hypothetical protein
MIFHHNAAANTTTYTLTTSETITSNIRLWFEEGVIIDGAGTLTLDSPAQIIAGPKQNIFGSSLTVTFTNRGEAPVDWWPIDGTADEVQINAAITALPEGAVLLNFDYVTAASIVPKSNVNISGAGKITLANNSDVDMIDFPASTTNVTIEGLEFDGNGVNQGAGEHMIINSENTGCSEITIKNNTLRNPKYDGIHHHEDTGDTGMNDLQIIGNKFYDFYNYAIHIYDSARVIISDNIIDNASITPTDDTGGISLSTCTNCVVSNNTINLSSGATVLSAGIGAGTANASAGNNMYNITITGNTINGNDGAYINGITIVGVSGTTIKNVVVSNNVIDGCKNDGGMGSIEVTSNVENAVVKGNIITDTVRGIVAGVGSVAGSVAMKNVVIKGNIIDTYTKTGIGVSGGIGSLADVIIMGNIVVNGTGVNGFAGIQAWGPVSHILIDGNDVKDNVNGEGIRINSSVGAVSDLTIRGNAVTGCTYGLFWFNTDFSYVTVTDNIFRSNATTIAYYPGTYAVIENNIGYSGGHVIDTLPNAAAVGIRALSGRFFIPGPTALTSITNGMAGAIIQLIATGNVTITDGAPLILAGGANYAMTADDTLTLMCKSADVWVELSRSVN